VTVHEHADGLPAAVQVVPLGVLAVLAVAYLAAVRPPWPRARTLCWSSGLVAAAVAVAGPVAAAGHADFRAHMVGHVLLGMLAPLLLVGGRPVTAALRALPVHRGRALVRVLRSPPVAVLTHPAVAAVLSVGGLWLLYRTGLHAATQQHPALHLLVQAHVLGSGYLFAASLVGRDPVAHRPRLAIRAAVLVAAVAAHNVLAKSLVAAPPPGVAADQAAAAGPAMYYLGAPLEIALFVLLGTEWAAADRRARAATAR
jgi:putative membrane protein